MDDFGLVLAQTYISLTFPNARGPSVLAQWEDVESIFFGLVSSASDAAEKDGRTWSEAAVEDLDSWLMDLAESGQVGGDFSVPKRTAEEMRRRCVFAVIAAGLEKKSGARLDMPFPSDIPPEARGVALMLYVLGGPARSYRREMFDR